MSERLAYVNGEYVKESEAQVSIYDRGFMLADAAFDVARTFGHRPFKLERHVGRLYRTLRYLDIDPRFSQGEMTQLATRVLEANLPLLPEDDDYWITMRVTRGLNPPYYSPATVWNPPTVLVYCTPIPFHTFQSYYQSGMRLITPSIRRTPPECIDPQAKTHERLNLVLGHMEVAQADPYALPLLLDLHGNITESYTANVFIVSQGGICTSSKRTVLAGITRETVIGLAHRIGVPVAERDITLFEAYNADECFLTATSFVVMPVSRINGRPIGQAVPGPVTRAMTAEYSTQVGIDIVAQAVRHASS